uniref:glycylpeptide N-tetradecanoyltransferase n=1 Tax=Mimivirus LCMiAC01 TaxID=2506608 RepID=A0A481Z044_9VIRU|nr:MAG: N-myristoyltransferase [Mimivirus LCMiAC01]
MIPINYFSKLPNDYEWIEYNMSQMDDCDTVSTFLCKYYMDSKKINTRTESSSNFLHWLFNIPNTTNICIGVRTSTKKTLVGCIVGSTCKLKINKNEINAVEIKYLCVHNKTRKKGLATRLIDQLKDIYQKLGFDKGIYCTKHKGENNTKSFYTAKYYHRPLNVDNLVKCGLLYAHNMSKTLPDFATGKTTNIQNNITIDDLSYTYMLPDVPYNSKDRKDGERYDMCGFIKINDNEDEDDNENEYKDEDKNEDENDYGYDFREMNENDIADAYETFVSYISKYNCYPVYTTEQFKYIFFNNDHVTTYVLLEDDEIVDLVSYYTIPTKIISKTGTTNKTIHMINRGYLYYYTSNEETSYRLIKDIMVVAKNNGVDDFFMLNIMENNDNLIDFNCVEIKHKINYCLHNVKIHNMQGVQIGKIIM